MSDDRDNPLDQLVELLVYAPVGLLYEYDEVVPRLVRRGRSQVALARFLGQAAVRRGSGGAEDALTGLATAGAGLLARAITELGVVVGLAPGDATTPSPDPDPAEGGPSDDGGAVPDADGADPVVADAATEAEADRSDEGTLAPGHPEGTVAPGHPEGTVAPGHPEGTVAPELPIANYDDLTARVIVPLLDDLTPAQRERIRRHEADNRARKTVLAKLDRLAGT